MGQGN